MDAWREDHIVITQKQMNLDIPMRFDVQCIKHMEDNFDEEQQKILMSRYEKHKDHFRERSKTFSDWYINFLKILEIF